MAETNPDDGTSQLPVPKEGWLDRAHTIASVIADLELPGGAAILSWLITPPLEKRREKFLEELARRMIALEKRGVDVKALASNDEFIDVVIQAAQSYARTSREAKREILLNAITNVGLGRSPGPDITAILMRLIDELSPLHVRLLEFIRDPPKWFAAQNIPMPSDNTTYKWLTHGLPEYRSDIALFDTVWAELRARALVPAKSLSLYERHEHIQLEGLSARFLELISSPIDNSK